MPTYIVLLGGPGSGKGTQAAILTGALGLTHISSGDIFRENLKNKTEMGVLANSYIARGSLVPDDVTIAMIRERLGRPDCQAGALLDGFPRTPAQADALDGIAAELGGRVKAVAFIDVPDEELVRRLAGRWTCRAQGHVYQAQSQPPKVPGVCDVDGSELYQREDDKPETVRRRLQVFMEQTASLVEHYTAKGLLVRVNGAQSVAKAGEDLLAQLRKRVA
jgi:adenylate kinase